MKISDSEFLSLILPLLEVQEVVAMSRVSKRFHCLCSNEEYWRRRVMNYCYSSNSINSWFKRYAYLSYEWSISIYQHYQVIEKFLFKAPKFSLVIDRIYRYDNDYLNKRYRIVFVDRGFTPIYDHGYPRYDSFEWLKIRRVFIWEEPDIKKVIRPHDIFLQVREGLIQDSTGKIYDKKSWKLLTSMSRGGIIKKLLGYKLKFDLSSSLDTLILMLVTEVKSRGLFFILSETWDDFGLRIKRNIKDQD